MSKNIVSQNVVVIPESVKEQLKKEVSEAFPGVVVTVNNLNIWVSGDTKPIKDELKAFGFRWASKRKAWFMRIPDNAKPYDGYQEQPEEQPEAESEQMQEIRAMLEQYKAGEISYDEYMERQKEICAECSARCAVKVAGDVAPANACPIAERPQKQIAGYLPAPKPKLTEEQQKLVDYYREYAEHLLVAADCMENVKCLLNGWQKPINKTFVDRMIELMNGISENNGKGKFYASWNYYNNKRLEVNYYPSNSYHYAIAGLSLLVESKTQKLTTPQKEALMETINKQMEHYIKQAKKYENMSEQYADYLEAKKQRDDAIAEANEAFNANKTFSDCETDAKYNTNYGKYNYIF